MKSIHAKICFATVTTDSYIAGTLVMLHSFLKTNPWFEGQIVIIHDGLSEQSMRWITLLNKDVCFRVIAPVLDNKIDEIVVVYPKLADIRSRFYSLEIFNIEGFDKYLFCDSDILFAGSVQDILQIDAEFVACDARISHYSPVYFSKMLENVGGESVSPRSLNTGLFVADKSAVSDEKFRALIRLIDKPTFADKIVTMADQIVINAAFSETYESISGTYNYLLSRDGYTFEGEEIGVKDAKVLHFVGPRNPWIPDQAIEQSIASGSMVKANAMWLSAYAECLTSLHFASQMQSGA